MVERRLRTSAALIHLSGSNFTAKLWGKPFDLKVKGQNVILTVHLGSNLRARDQHARVDARDTIEQHEKLRFLQIDNNQVIDGLAWGWARAKAPPKMVLVLAFGEHGTFSYRVNPRSTAGDGLQLDVVEPLGLVRSLKPGRSSR